KGNGDCKGSHGPVRVIVTRRSDVSRELSELVKHRRTRLRHPDRSVSMRHCSGLNGHPCVRDLRRSYRTGAHWRPDRGRHRRPAAVRSVLRSRGFHPMHLKTLRLRALVLALGFTFAAGAIAQTAPAPVDVAAPDSATPADTTAALQDFDAYVENVRKQFDVPAIAGAIVKDGQVGLERGYGVKDLESREPVDEKTLFAIASNTKAFTAASLQMLAEDGKLEMDDRVIDHLPWFRMSDPYITHEMRINDLLAHRSGLALGAGDLPYWPGTDYDTKEVARRLRNVPIDGGFRAQYAYDNILFGVAQLVIEAASGQSYEDFLRSRILQPLDMDATRFNSDHLQPGDNV